MDSLVNIPSIGDKLSDRFRIVFGRGSGPCGTVFKALDLALDLPVAVKVFKPELFSSEFREQNLRRLYRARAYQDESLVKIYEVQEDRGLHFITCQLMEGMSLSQVLDLHAENGEHFTVPKIRALATRLISGLSTIHRAGAIHGNLKPQNIFVLPDRLVLSDPYYLVARLLQEGEEIPVSDYYRGPEQLTDPGLELQESDIYSLALIIGEVIGGNPVKPGLALSQQVPRLTARFDDLFVAATDTEPSRRPHSLEEFGDRLLELLSKVESEGLWARRYHETGSFRAVRMPRPEAEARPSTRIEAVTQPEVSVAQPEQVSPTPSPVSFQEPPSPPEPQAPMPEPAAVAEMAETTPNELVTVEKEVESLPTEPIPIERSETVAFEAVSQPVSETKEVEEVAPISVEVVEEGVEVSAPTQELDEELLEAIEVLPEEQPVIETPPVPAEALEEEIAPPEAVGGMLEVESVAHTTPISKKKKKKRAAGPVIIPPQPAEQKPTQPLEQKQPLEHKQPPQQPERGPEPAPTVQPKLPPVVSVTKSKEGSAKNFLLLVALAVVVGGAAVLVYLKMNESTETSAPKPEEKPAPTLRTPQPPATATVKTTPSQAAPTTPPPSPQVPPPVPVSPPTPTTPPAVVAQEAPKKLAAILKCPAGMAKVVTNPDLVDSPSARPSDAAFCIDQFEFPGKGEKPKTQVSAAAAAKLCKEAGKRLCSGNEWRQACGTARYVYGEDYDEKACNVSGKVQETGVFPSCRSKDGVYDLIGNVSEWASDGLLHGGDATSGKGATCQSTTKRFMPGPTNGFRCCTEPSK